jgi:HlyD family secretion protein
MNKNLFNASIIAILVIGAIVGVYVYKNLSERPSFATYQVTKGDISEAIDITGKIKSENVADLGFEIGGRITALNYKVGDRVSKGVIIATANDADLRAQYSVALAEIRSAEALLKQSEELKNKESYDLKALKSPNDTSNDKKAQKEQIEASKAVVEAQGAQLEAARSNAQIAKAEIDKTIIRAPFSGVISKQDVEVGEVAQSNVPILTIINNGEFKIEAFVSEIDAKKIQEGNAVKVTSDSNPGVEYNAKITAIDPAETLINNISSYKITIHFDQNNPELVSGTGINAKIELQKKEGVLIVPKNAVFEDNNKKYIYVSMGGLREKKEIKTGVYGEDNMVEIISGLSEGDIIFTVK